MFCCLMKIGIKQYKNDEFVQSVYSLMSTIRQDRSCLYYTVYRDAEQDNLYCIVGEWKTRQALEKHFQTREFELLLGAAKVLSESFSMELAEVVNAGDFDFARAQRNVIEK